MLRSFLSTSKQLLPIYPACQSAVFRNNSEDSPYSCYLQTDVHTCVCECAHSYVCVCDRSIRLQSSQEKRLHTQGSRKEEAVVSQGSGTAALSAQWGLACNRSGPAEPLECRIGSSGTQNCESPPLRAHTPVPVCLGWGTMRDRVQSRYLCIHAHVPNHQVVEICWNSTNGFAFSEVLFLIVSETLNSLGLILLNCKCFSLEIFLLKLSIQFFSWLINIYSSLCEYELPELEEEMHWNSFLNK